MKNNNTENNIMNHKDALEKADEQAELGKKYITDIAMTCSNDYTVIDSLMQILELFTLKDADASVCDLAEDLQGYLFQWTKEYGNALDGWKDSVMFGDKYKNASENAENESLEILAGHLSAIMKHPTMPTNLYNVIADELTAFPANADADSPEWILANLKLQSKAKKQAE